MVPLRFPTGWTQSPGDPGWAGAAILPHCWSAATSVLKPALFDHHHIFSSSFLLWSPSLGKKSVFSWSTLPILLIFFILSLTFQWNLSLCFLPFLNYFPSILWQGAEALSKRDVKLSAQGAGLTHHSHPGSLSCLWAAYPFSLQPWCFSQNVTWIQEQLCWAIIWVNSVW